MTFLHTYQINMKYFHSLLFFFASVLFFISCKAENPPGFNKYDSYLQEIYSEGKFNGNVLVFEKGKIAHQGAYGIKSIDPIDSLELRDAFRLASVSKQFTAMAIMILTTAVSKLLPN